MKESCGSLCRREGANNDVIYKTIGTVRNKLNLCYQGGGSQEVPKFGGVPIEGSRRPP